VHDPVIASTLKSLQALVDSQYVIALWVNSGTLCTVSPTKINACDDSGFKKYYGGFVTVSDIAAQRLLGTNNC
jgi:hypothetical protein